MSTDTFAATGLKDLTRPQEAAAHIVGVIEAWEQMRDNIPVMADAGVEGALYLLKTGAQRQYASGDQDGFLVAIEEAADTIRNYIERAETIQRRIEPGMAFEGSVVRGLYVLLETIGLLYPCEYLPSITQTISQAWAVEPNKAATVIDYIYGAAHFAYTMHRGEKALAELPPAIDARDKYQVTLTMLMYCLRDRAYKALLAITEEMTYAYHKILPKIYQP